MVRSCLGERNRSKRMETESIEKKAWMLISETDDTEQEQLELVDYLTMLSELYYQ